MLLQRQSNGKVISLDLKSSLGHGGEAHIYPVPQDERVVAKVYHQPTEIQKHKLFAMLAHPPENLIAQQWHFSIAWPIDILKTVDRIERVVGFLMPRVVGMNSLINFYNPKSRSQQCPFFNYRYLHRTARNLASAVATLHRRGYCIGDVNESNILVSSTGLVTLIDTDSFQLRDPENGIVYRCCVGKPEFTPPELQGKSFRLMERAVEHDLFGLAVLIFQLLMEGTHPFSGIFQGMGDPPAYSARIAAGHFSYSTSRHGPYIPTLIAPPFEILPHSLQELFVRCFEDGHDNPKMRPSAYAWQNALDEAEESLVVCSNNEQHYYGNHLNACPWCERTLLLGGRDPFPSLRAAQQKQYLQPAQQVTDTPHMLGRALSGFVNKSKGYLKPSQLSALTGAPTSPTYLHSHKLTSPSAVVSAKREEFRFTALTLLGAATCGFVLPVTIYRSFELVNNLNFTGAFNNNNAALSKEVSSNKTNEKILAKNNKSSEKIRHYKQAIEKYKKTLKTKPNDVKAYLNRADLLDEIARYSGNPDAYYKQALKNLNIALSLNYSNAEAYFKRGVVRSQIAQYSNNPNSDYEEAIKDLNMALHFAPDDAATYRERGIVRYNLAQYSGELNKVYRAAIEDFGRALRLNANDAEAYLHRGIAFYEMAQYNGDSSTSYIKAVADLQKAAKIFHQQGNTVRYQQALEVCRQEQLGSMLSCQ